MFSIAYTQSNVPIFCKSISANSYYKRHAISNAIMHLLNVKNNIQVFLKETKAELPSSEAQRAICLEACALSTLYYDISI